MKKFLQTITVFALGLLLFTACRSDDNDSDLPSIVGSWQPISLKVTGVLNGQSFSETVNANQCQLQSRSTFQANGTGVSKVWDDASGTCTQSPDHNFTYTYNADTKALTVVSDGSTQSGTVNVLSDTQLVYSMPSTYDYNGVNVPVTMEITAKRSN